MIGCGLKCAKILIIFFNIILWITGAGLAALGVWFTIDDDFKKQSDLFQDSELFPEYFPYIMIAAGVLILMIGLIGCCGAVREHQTLLGVFILCIVLIMGLEIAGCVYVYLNRYDILNDMERDLKNSLKKYYGASDSKSEAFTEAMDYVQREFTCCGIQVLRGVARIILWHALVKIPSHVTRCCVKVVD